MDIKFYLQQLVINSEAKHYPKIKDAIWLLLYLLLTSGTNTWIIVRKVDEIASQMGVDCRTVRCWLKILQKQGYILVKAAEPQQFIHLRGGINLFSGQKKN